MRFTTNHDKNAWDAPAVKKFGPEGLKLATVLVNTLPGVPMIYTGEEVANDRKLDLFEKVDVDWTRPRVVGEIYRTLFELRTQNSALSRGELVRVTGTAANDVYAFLRIAGKAARLCRAELLRGAAPGEIRSDSSRLGARWKLKVNRESCRHQMSIFRWHVGRWESCLQIIQALCL